MKSLIRSSKASGSTRQKIRLSEIITDAGTQCRAGLSNETVCDYTEGMNRGDKFPPVVVFTDGNSYWLADGFHRIAAAMKNGMKEILCDARIGNRQDAIKFALGANAIHGLRRTNADKRKAVEIALMNWPELSSNELGRVCAVSRQFVEGVRGESQGVTVTPCPSENPSKSRVSVSPPPRIGADGKRYPAPPPRSEIVARPASKVEVIDGTGLPIPPESLAFWGRSKEVEPILDKISELRRLLEGFNKSGDILFTELNLITDIALLKQLHLDVELALPHAVCHKCNGKILDGDCLCRGRGFVSKFYWKHNVSEDLKKVTGRK